MVTKRLTTATLTTVIHLEGGRKLDCSHTELACTRDLDAVVAISVLRAVQFSKKILILGQGPSSTSAISFQNQMSALAQLPDGKPYQECGSIPIQSMAGTGSPACEPYPQQIGFLDCRSLQRQVEFSLAVHDSVQSRRLNLTSVQNLLSSSHLIIYQPSITNFLLLKKCGRHFHLVTHTPAGRRSAALHAFPAQSSRDASSLSG